MYSIFFIIATILGSILSYYLIKRVLKDKKWASFNPARLILVIIFLSVIVIVIGTYQIDIRTGTTESDVIEIVRNLEKHDVKCIKLYPGDMYITQMRIDTIYIYDKSGINEFSGIIQNVEPYLLFEICSIWVVNVSIVLEDKVLENILFKIIRNNDGKCIVCIRKKDWLGQTPLGYYSCSYDLIKFIEKNYNVEKLM